MQITRRNFRLVSFASISPFFGAMYAILHPRDPSSKNLVWLFTVFYGAVFYISKTAGTDSVRYLAQLKFMHAEGYSFSDLLAAFYIDANSYQDVYQPFLTFLVSRVTDNTWLLFGSFGVLFGYVYSRNIWFIIDRVPGKLSLLPAVLLIAFAMDVNIGVGLNGVRMWTALHVFIFGFLNFIDRRQKRYLLVLMFTPLIHFSFVVPCVAMVAYLLVRSFRLAIYLFFASSFLVANIDIGAIRQLAEYLPLTMEDRALTYVSLADPSLAPFSPSNRSAWFLILNERLMALFVFLASTFLVVRGVGRRPDVAGSSLLFGMAAYALTNLVAYVPSAVRFYDLGEMLILVALILYLTGQPRSSRLDTQLGFSLVPLLIINIAVGARLFLEFASPILLVGNFFIAPFIDSQIGLYEIIDQL